MENEPFCAPFPILCSDRETLRELSRRQPGSHCLHFGLPPSPVHPDLKDTQGPRLHRDVYSGLQMLSLKESIYHDRSLDRQNKPSCDWHRWTLTVKYRDS